MRRSFVRALFVNQRGLGLAEILVSCVILAVGLVALASVIPLAAYGIQEGKQVSTATFLANARLEQIKHARWTDIPDVDELGGAGLQSAAVAEFPDEPSPPGPPAFPPLPPASYAGYSRQVRVTDCSTGCPGVPSSSELRQVTVTVGFRPLTGVGGATADKFISLTTLVAKK